MLVAVLSGFALACAAPAALRLGGAASGWILALLPVCLATYFAGASSGVWAGKTEVSAHAWASNLDVVLSFRLDGLSLLFALLITVLGAIVLVYGGGYLAGHPRRGRFYAFLLFFMASMLGVVLADNLLLLFVFWELTSISSYLLIGFENQREAARRAALQSLLVTSLGGLSLLAGFVLLGRMGGSFELSALLEQADQIRVHAHYHPALALILLGAFTKSAQFPFHFWLPAAMEAPTPVSAYLHAATMVKAGIYLLARLSPVLGGTEAWFWPVTCAGAVTMLLGGLIGFTKTDLKQILAYSTVSMLGMLTFLLGLGTPLALQAMLVSLAAHGLYKGALFLVAGAVDHGAGTRDISRLGGLFKAMPLTASAGLLAALSMAGVPPLMGFVGKELVYEAGARAGRMVPALVGFLVATAILLFALAGLAGFRPFFSRGSKPPAPAHEAPATLWIGPVLLGLAGLTVGLRPTLMERAVESALGAMSKSPPAPVHLGLFHGLTVSLLLSIVSAAGGCALYALHRRVLSAGARWSGMAKWGPARWYELALNTANRLAVLQTRALQSGYLRRYVLAVIVSTLALVGFALLRDVRVPLRPGIGKVRPHEAALIAVILVSSLAAVRSNSRLTAAAALGGVGVAMALIFALFGAPDLAMTQFAVETLTVILLVLVLYHLPDYSALTGRGGRRRDAIISVAGGALMGTLAVAAASVQHAPSIAPYYVENSYVRAHGRNVVNVILTDFRVLDTMGEITVLAVAAVGVWALLRLRPGKGGRK